MLYNTSYSFILHQDIILLNSLRYNYNLKTKIVQKYESNQNRTKNDGT